MSIPVSVLTGFLGAGKTTVLRAFLADDAANETAVLVNEFGEVGIDHLLVDAISPDTVLLDSGCVCCQIRGELKEAIITLLDQRVAGTIPQFKRIVIETTGLAEPGPIVSTLTMDTVLSRQISIGNVVTVIDALAAEGTAQRREEWFAQIAVADTLLLAKTDLVDEDTVARVSANLQAVNPGAEVVAWRDTPACLAGLFDQERRLDAGAVARDGVNSDQRDTLQTPPTAIPHSRGHASQITSFVIEIDGQINWTAFGVWLSALLHAHGDRVLRIKGLLDVGETAPVLFNCVQHTVYPPEHTSDVQAGQAGTSLVFIVEDLAEASIRASFESMIVGA